MSNGGSRDFSRLLQHWRKLRRESQLGLGQRAGVSPKHVAFLETGRARPSREMILTLARALDVPLRERNALLRAAGFADAYAESSLEAPAIEPALRALKFILARHEPYPAMVIDSAWNLLLANTAAGRLVTLFLERPVSSRVNVLRLLCEPQGLRPFVENWSEIVGHLVQRLHRESLGLSNDSPGPRLLADLCMLPGVSSVHEHRTFDAATLPFIPLVLRRGELRLNLFSLISSFGTAVDVGLHDLRIETLLAADDESELALRTIAGDSAFKDGRGPRG